GLVAQREPVARVELFARRRQVTADHLEPGVPAGSERVYDPVARGEQARRERYVPVNLDRAVPPVGRGDLEQAAAARVVRERALLVARGEPLPLGEDPDLEQVELF